MAERAEDHNDGMLHKYLATHSPNIAHLYLASVHQTMGLLTLTCH